MNQSYYVFDVMSARSKGSVRRLNSFGMRSGISGSAGEDHENVGPLGHLISPSGVGRTMQRNPRCEVAVSTACGIRAAGR